MSYHPHITHFIAGSYNLLMVVAVCDEGSTAVSAFINIVAVKAGTEALLFIKLIVIHLRLGVVVGRIA